MPDKYCSRCEAPMGEDVSFCQKCGEPANGKNKKPKQKKYATLKTGAAVNLLGGVGLLIMVGMMLALGSQSSREADVTISLSSMPETMFAIANVCLVLVTVLSLVLLCLRNPKRKVSIAISFTMLCLTGFSIAADIFTWNLTICCGMWLAFWGTAVQLVGSIISVKGALKIKD